MLDHDIHVESTPTALILVSILWLFLACADDGLVGQLAKLSWLGSVLLLAFTDIGGAFGIYVASVAIFSPTASAALFGLRARGGWAALLDRPDNYALLFIVLGLTFMGLKRTQTLAAKRFTIIVVLFLVYGLLQMTLLGVATRSDMAWFFRAYGAFCLAVLLWRAAPCLKDIDRFAVVVTVLGGYMAAVSLLEAAGWYSWVIPRWIAEPSFYPLDNNSIAAGRAGGLLMQSEFNGAALGLTCCIIVASRHLGYAKARVVKGAVFILCLAAIYFTYTRAAWLAVAVGIAILSVSGIRSERDRRKTAVQVVGALLITTALILVPNPRASERLRNSENAYFRLNVWAAGLKMAADRPLIGYGYGQFASQMDSYHAPVGSLPFKRLSSEGTVAHNVFLNVLVEEGGVGLLLYVLVVLTLYRNASKSASRAWGAGGVKWVVAVCAVYFINMQFISGYEPTSNLILFGSMGMLAGLAESPRKAHAGT